MLLDIFDLYPLFVLCITTPLITNGLQCMQCTGVSSPEDCLTKVTCSDLYQCFTDFYVTEQGFLYYDLGCRIDQLCQVLSGQHTRALLVEKRQFTNLHLCEECCTTDFCNRQGCPENSVTRVNNTLCFNCQDANNPAKCDTVDVCNHDEICLAALVLTESFQERYQLRCEKKHICDRLVGGQFYGQPNQTLPIALGRRQIQFPLTECQYCCESSFCNNKVCVRGATPPSHVETTSIFTVQTSCPVDWAEYKGECLYFGNSRQRWLDAENQCRKFHAYLATDDNADKHNFISNILSVLHSLHQNTFWIGANDFAIEGSFRWLETGLPIGNYTAWGSGKPTRNDTNNCIRMFYNGDQYKWEDVACGDRTTYYICEKPAENTATVTTENVQIIGK